MALERARARESIEVRMLVSYGKKEQDKELSMLQASLWTLGTRSLEPIA